MTYVEALLEPVRVPIFKIEWMDQDENVINEIVSDMATGNIAAEFKNGMRRSCNLNLENEDGRYLPDRNGLIYVDKKFKLYTGLVISGVSTYQPQGIFTLGNPDISSNRAEQTARIEAYDNFSLFDNQLKTDYIIDIGTVITDAVAQIFVDANFPTTPIIQTSTETLPYTIVKEAGDTYTDLLLELADILSWEVFCDTNGRGRFQPPITTSVTSEEWIFGQSEVTYLGGDYNSEFDGVKNSIVVYGENINGGLVTATAQDNNIFSPTSISRIGEKVDVIVDPNIYSTQLAQDRADFELQNAIQIYQNANIKCTPVDILKEGNIILIDDVDSGNNRIRYQINSFNLPLGYSEQQNITITKLYE